MGPIYGLKLMKKRFALSDSFNYIYWNKNQRGN